MLSTTGLDVRVRGSGYDRAILDFNQALKLTPNDPGAVYGRGRACAQNGEYLRAMARPRPLHVAEI